MIRFGKNRFVCILLLLGLTLPATGQVYTTSKAKVHSVSTSGVGYDSWSDNGNYGGKYGPSSSFRSTSSYMSSGPSYSVSVPSVSVKTAFSTVATVISGGATTEDASLFEPNSINGPHFGPPPPVIKPEDNPLPIGDIPWVVLVLAALAFVVIKRSRGVEE